MDLPDNPKDFYNLIPTNVQENLRFRIDLHSLLGTDKKLQDLYLELCLEYFPILFSSCFWTYNPQKIPGERNQPFILRPKQIEAVENLDWCVKNGVDFGINKSRKEGASEIIVKYFIGNALLNNDTHFILGSRTKELVDNIGDPTTLFAKADYAIASLPPWLRKRIKYNPKTDRKDMQLKIRITNSSLSGSTTNESFSAGSRATGLLLDENGRVYPLGLAESIEGSVHDISDCVIYNSTHWYGENHPFNKAIQRKSTKVITLFWWENPEESYGLYATPKPGIVELIDVSYYKKNHPEIFEFGKVCSPEGYPIPKPYTESFRLEIAKLPKKYHHLFIADGGIGLPLPLRSPWHDEEEEKRKGNKRDFYCNIWGTPVGSADCVFDTAILAKIEKKCKPPLYEGEIIFDYDDFGKIARSSFVVNHGRKRLKWWRELKYNRPNQEHNYIIGCDPSYGMGSSNSVASVYDVNTFEEVGKWVCPNTPPEDFADLVIALSKWIGGVNESFIIWENNGGHGVNFTNRLVWHHYPRLYTQKVEDAKVRKVGKRYGWRSNRTAKAHLLGELGLALSGGLSEKDYKSIKIYDIDLLNELRDYMYVGSEITSSEKADLPSGARERHGDRVIAAALCVLGTRDAPPGFWERKKSAPFGTFAHRFFEEEKKDKEKERKEKFRRRVYLFK